MHVFPIGLINVRSKPIINLTFLLQTLQSTRIVMEPNMYRQIAESYIASRKAPVRRTCSSSIQKTHRFEDLVCDSGSDTSLPPSPVMNTSLPSSPNTANWHAPHRNISTSLSPPPSSTPSPSSNTNVTPNLSNYRSTSRPRQVSLIIQVYS